jgi:recombination protein RecT
MTTLTIRDRLNDPKQLAEIAKALPKHMSAERMARVVMTAMTRTPLLAECEPASFFKCLLDLSQWGLEPNGRDAHLIPFRNNKRGVVECQLILDYKGLVQLIMRTGNVASIHADKVCDADEFEVNCGQIVRHSINYRKPRGDAYAYHCIITMKDGSRKCEVMTMEEVDAIRRRSKSANNGPWVTDYDEMAKKTVFKRASKWVEVSPEIREAIAHDDRDYIDGRVTRSETIGIDATEMAAMLAAPVADEAEPEAVAATALFESSPDAASE